MKLFRLAAPLIAAAALAAASAAQCLIPDNLDIAGAACQGTMTQVPQRGFKQQALGLCWQDCQVNTQAPCIAVWGALNPILVATTPPQASCAWYRARLRIYNTGGGLEWDGQMHFSYARTWVESPVPGQVLQVWRYLVNGDLVPQSAAAGPCGAPPCAPPNGNLVRFTGYVDYAYDCATTLTHQAWMLNHACDAIDHVPGFPRAGVFHPNRHYSFVGPGPGFVAMLGGTLEVGGTNLESMRKWDALALPARCNTEEPLAAANINPNAMTCMCGVGPANWYEGTLAVNGAFGSFLGPFPGSDPFRSFPVGMWTNPAVFPGNEELRWNCNEGLYVDCTGIGRQEYYFGVTTAGGYQAFSLPTSMPSMPLPPTFVDQSNSVVLPLGIATRNRPYRSDHMVNLNF